MPTGERAIYRAVRRRRPIAFWHVSQDQLVVATLRPGEDEPTLLSCAGVRAVWYGRGSAICPGLLDVARCGAGSAWLHAAALSELAGATIDLDIEVDCEGRIARYARAVIAEVRAGFETAGLRLATLQAEPWARVQLLRFLGGSAERRSADRCLADDPLAAVTVAPECEAQAAALGPHLAVPIGLGLAYLVVSRTD
jgi:hypothetical protein